MSACFHLRGTTCDNCRDMVERSMGYSQTAGNTSAQKTIDKSEKLRAELEEKYKPKRKARKPQRIRFAPNGFTVEIGPGGKCYLGPYTVGRYAAKQIHNWLTQYIAWAEQEKSK
jgi:hypothetical protein